jgi:hypothetical protein
MKKGSWMIDNEIVLLQLKEKIGMVSDGRCWIY